MEIQIDCDFDEETAIFSPKLWIFLFGGDILEHPLPKWRISTIDKYFGGFRYSHFVLTLIKDPAVSIVIGTNPLESKKQIIRYCQDEIGQFVTKIAKSLGGRPESSCLKSLTPGRHGVTIYKIPTKLIRSEAPE